MNDNTVIIFRVESSIIPTNFSNSKYLNSRYNYKKVFILGDAISKSFGETPKEGFWLRVERFLQTRLVDFEDDPTALKIIDCVDNEIWYFSSTTDHLVDLLSKRNSHL